ncbi:MAG: TonB-dependent receptor plug domain-containing protein [Gammaproteobacteria bacterium]|nr:TonB-dependent receptor plug domain-containing protein [Gammaproteobacteria bacterium]MYC53317.1 TonB-dependent receptor plug domain-containing protein [Gammaproteobacteria bacterium]
MGGRKMNRTPLRGLTLAGLTLTAVVMACDTGAPTALDDALLDALADPEAAVNADGADNPGALQIRGALGDGAPLVFVDGVELETGSDALSSLNPDDIESIEVIKGEAAADLYGDRAANGVIRILTIESPGG